MVNAVVHIPKRAFVATNVRTAARILLMASCSGALWALHYVAVLPAPLPALFGSTAVVLCSCAVLALCRPWPRDRRAMISPHIIIPAPLVSGGFDSRATPIKHWWLHRRPSQHIEYTTTHASGILRADWFNDCEWQSLLRSLPAKSQPEGMQQTERIRLCFIVFFALCLGVHCLPSDPSIPESMHRLELGAHHWPLIRTGEIHRALSYAVVHLNDMHLWLNGIALALVATALRQGYSNKSLTALMLISAISSGSIGTLVGNYAIASGSSGVVMGLFGFLIAAQRQQDPRLHPLNRVARHNILYAFLAGELLATLTLKWYGGGIHLVGLATGYLYYIACETTRKKAPDRLTRWFQTTVLLVGVCLAVLWGGALYTNQSTPERLARKLVALNDPLMTPLAGLRIAQSPSTTAEEIIALKRQALSHVGVAPSNRVLIARANYWLGDLQSALLQMREHVGLGNHSTAAQHFWLALEALSLNSSTTPITDNRLAAGSGAVLLVSSDQSHLARIRRRSTHLDLSTHILQPKGVQWHFVSNLSISDSAPEGVWQLEPTQYRTRDSASTAAASTNSR